MSDEPTLPAREPQRQLDFIDEFVVEELDPRARGELMGWAVASTIGLATIGVSMALVSTAVGPFMWLAWGAAMVTAGAFLGFVAGIRMIRSKLRQEVLTDLMEDR